MRFLRFRKDPRNFFALRVNHVMIFFSWRRLCNHFTLSLLFHFPLLFLSFSSVFNPLCLITSSSLSLSSAFLSALPYFLPLRSSPLREAPPPPKQMMKFPLLSLTYLSFSLRRSICCLVWKRPMIFVFSQMLHAIFFPLAHQLSRFKLTYRSLPMRFHLYF